MIQIILKFAANGNEEMKDDENKDKKLAANINQHDIKNIKTCS